MVLHGERSWAGMYGVSGCTVVMDEGWIGRKRHACNAAEVTWCKWSRRKDGPMYGGVVEGDNIAIMLWLEEKSEGYSVRRGMEEMGCDEREVVRRERRDEMRRVK